jgi:methyl-accepting chemotaxis protein
MAEITAASLEQSSGIEQVNQAIVQMDQVTQQNAALAEESAAAASAMEAQAQQLASAVSVFKLAGGNVATPAKAVIERAQAAAKAAGKRFSPAGARTRNAPAVGAAAAANTPRLAKSKASVDGEWAEF